jgi:hypothetical protein
MKRLKHCVSLLLLASAVCVAWNAPRQSAAAVQDVQFNRDIRPLLSDRCFYCHGPDEKNRKAGLRLDTFEGATKDRGGYRAIAPGKPDESELLKRVTAHDPGEVMPPPRAKKTAVTPAEASLLRRWIAQGALYQGHWAFQPLAAARPPAVNNTNRVRNDIDRFILARLEREGLAPSPQADPRTLIRRVSLDLTGLTPQPAEVEAFVKAFSKATPRQPDAAYGALVERLLASPHYGERWGRHWLDQARYADSNGYTIDGERVMWPYRDWVIQALNEDKPFDQFTIEQLAGDLPPNPTKSQLVATGFHRNTVINEEGGVDPEQARVEQVMDRVSTTGAVWMGLTVGCAQCHTHKFDPITHKEYYRMFAFFNSTMDVNNQGPAVTVARGEMFGRPETARAVEAPLARRNMPPAELKQGDWEKLEIARLERNPAVTAPKKEVEWVSFDPVKFDTEAAGKLQRLEDGSFLIAANASANDAYRILVRLASPRVAAVRLRVAPHAALPKNGPGLAADGSFALSEFYIDSEGGQHRFNDAFAPAAADEQPAYPAPAAADGDRRTGWSGQRNDRASEAVFVYSKPKEFASRQIQFILRHEAETNHGIGHFKIEVAAETPHDGRGAARLEALKLPLNARSPEQRTMVNAAFASARAVREKQAGNAVMAMIMRDIAVPRDSYLFTRGDFTRPDKAAGLLKPGVPGAIAPALPETDKPRTRLDLARWLVHPANPLTPRVTMNRVWMRYFGRGLVETEEDFGTQGARPTHPELLDWLAGEFIRRGWSLKAMHRLIVASATYRQSSDALKGDARKDLNDIDPRNLLLARQERFRVEAEIVRDAALSASGLLDPHIGGPSVRPPQPDGVYAFTQNRKNWTTATGTERFRRAMYTHFYRSAPYPLFSTFDAPDFQTVCTRRHRSNTPLQSLTLANDPAFLEIARGLAGRLVRDVPGEFAATLDARLKHAFALCFSRPPHMTELAALRGYVQRQAQSFASQPASAKALSNKELAKAGLTDAQAAALTAAARVLFNTDNFITRE